MNAIEALDNAYETCWLVRDQLANVIASGDFGESDVLYHKRADNFIKWYNGKKRKGDWREKLEKSMPKLLTNINEITK